MSTSNTLSNWWNGFSRDRDDERLIAWLFVAPAIVLLAMVAIYPFAQMIYDSLFGFTQAGERAAFVGIANYGTVLSDPRFLNATGFTVIFVVVSVTIEFLLGLGVSLLLYSAYIERRQLLVTLSIPPMIMSPIITGLTWRMLFSPSYGMVNHLLGLNIDWIASRPWSRVALIVADVWMWTPLFVLVFTAALQSIPDVYYEAAEVDGMSKWQQFKWITLPQMRTAIVVVMLLRIVRAFKVFPKVQVLTQGGPGAYTETIAMMTYNYGFRFFQLGVASASGVLYWLLMFLTAFVLFKSVAEGLISPEED
ncbi:carbohydrate ABC transporter permease [Haladaptatus sp. R4]|uniref:carbohydrate ABC transporter permease n=1 Tax=Haladaptatus sp. R4 TaxID=1679489 RepID=UPI000ACEA4A2|nr:sugar ABC transporter permease [Haladaptatus sp. R4]